MAVLIRTKAGHRQRLVHRVHLDRGPAKGRPKDNLNTHVSRTVRELTAARWRLTVHQLPPYVCEFNPAQDVWLPTSLPVNPPMVVALLDGAGAVRRQIVAAMVPCRTRQDLPSGTRPTSDQQPRIPPPGCDG